MTVKTKKNKHTQATKETNTKLTTPHLLSMGNIKSAVEVTVLATFEGIFRALAKDVFENPVDHDIAPAGPRADCGIVNKEVVKPTEIPKNFNAAPPVISGTHVDLDYVCESTEKVLEPPFNKEVSADGPAR